MSLIIAVKSCQAHQSYHQAIRDTWGPTVHAPVLFFMGGNTNRVFEDEHVVPSPDDYMSLPTKTQQILRWLVRNETFDHVYLCDNDTFVRSSRFANLEYPKYDYSGHMNKLCDVGKTAFYRDHIAVFNECHPWASGGIGYFLSHRAAKLIAFCEPNVWAEDLWVGQVMGPQIQEKKMFGSHLENFNEHAAWHFKRTRKYPQYDPEMMYRSWELGTPDKMYAEDNQR